MRKRIVYLAAAALTFLLGVAQAVTITVNTENNLDFSAGKTNLYLALSLAKTNGAAANTINFNIPGLGAHYLKTPTNGYPMITSHNLTIDGYTQPGSAPNTNPILAANNAQIKIVLDSRIDPASPDPLGTSMDYAPGAGNTGFGAGEVAILGLFRATNFWAKGLCFLGQFSANYDMFGVGIAGDFVETSHHCHVSGCWFGVDLDGTTVSSGFVEQIAAHRHRDNPATAQVGSDFVTVGVAVGSANPRAEFNVFLGAIETINIEANNPRISGNFIGVYPSGNKCWIGPIDGASLGIGDNWRETHIEIGRFNKNTVIGVDGDGVNDADERNIFGGVLDTTFWPQYSGYTGLRGYTHTIEFYGNNTTIGTNFYGPSTNNIIAGNYFGVGVDGVTRFTNGVPALDGGNPQTRFGSDGDGVSDALEGNVVFNNYPTNIFDPGLFLGNGGTVNPTTKSFYDGLGTTSIRNAQRNTLVNNFPFPSQPASGGGTFLINYYNQALLTPATVTSELYPTIAPTSTLVKLKGTIPIANATYPTTIIDLYVPDKEGIANGLLAADPDQPYGWIQGKTHVGSFVAGSASDLDPSAGGFEFDISTLNLVAGPYTITATYSKSPSGTHNAIGITSPFAVPRSLQAPHGNIILVTVADDGTPANIGAPGTFYRALTNAQAGDSIAFDIPGPGPHYLQIPPSGFPLIYRKHNLIVDGYSQPGAYPNNNPLTAANNATLKIVIDGRNGNARDMQYKNYNGTPDASDPPIDNSFMPTEQAGYTSITESALLGVYRATNVMIRGLAFLGSFNGPNGDVQKGICFAHDYDGNATIVPNSTTNYGFYASGSDAYGHVNGCWFGIDPTNQTIAGVAGFRIAVTGYRHRDTSGGTLGVDRRPELPNIGMTVGVKRGSANPRAQFNVAAGLEQFVSFEPVRMTISGNFVGVMPDGVTAYNYLQDSPSPGTYRGSPIDLGRYDDTQPIVIGTDGDGVNDADEGNLFGPLQILPNGTMNTQLGVYSTARKPYIIAGNRFGIAVDGTRWTNNIFHLIGPSLNSGTQVRFGSDFNGVSDNLEANYVYNMNVFADQYPTPSAALPFSLIRGQNSINVKDGWFSLRGNRMVNNLPNFNPAGTVNNAAYALRYMESWSNYIAYPTGSSTVPGTTIPALSASTTTTLNGTCGASTNGYTNLVVDVYLPDPEGQTNGALFGYEIFGAPSAGVAGGWGFVQGKTYLGSFLDNGPYDSNPAVGAFSLNIASLGLTSGTKVTVAVTYSAFARPVLATPVVSGSNVTLAWTGDNGGPYTSATAGGSTSGFGIQRASNPAGPWTTTFAANNSITLPSAGAAGFYRVVAPLSGMTTLCAPPVVLQ